MSTRAGPSRLRNLKFVKDGDCDKRTFRFMILTRRRNPQRPVYKYLSLCQARKRAFGTLCCCASIILMSCTAQPTLCSHTGGTVMNGTTAQVHAQPSSVANPLNKATKQNGTVMNGHDRQTSGGRTLHHQQTALSCLCPSCSARARVSKLPGHRNATNMHAWATVPTRGHQQARTS